MKGLKILDVGSGDEIKFNDPKHNITHIDINSNSFHLEVLTDGYNLPFKNRSFDIVFCSHVLEHLINPFLFVGELKRVANLGVVIKIPNSKYYETFATSPAHVFGWSPFNFRNFLKPFFGKVCVYSSFRIPPKKQNKFKRKLRTLKIIFLSLFFGKNEVTALCWI